MWIRVRNVVLALSLCLIASGQIAYAAEKKAVLETPAVAIEQKAILEKATLIKASLASTPAVYRGDCPVVIKFNGSITSNKAGAVTYLFSRSDGATDTVKTAIFSGSGTKPVTDTWTLGGISLPYFKGWEAIKVLSPSAVTSNQANFEIRCNPPLNSAISAHGNIDWHIDTANEFLFGKDMNGATTAPNHAPDSWTKRHMHVGLTNTSKYYYDKTKTPGGGDNDITSGIDKAMLFFYAGHGGPDGWSTLGDGASQNFMALSNVEQGGMLRYYWQCSCEVFAHGPKTCAGTDMVYACPQNFSGGADSDNMRNVFQRWGPALRPDLRMACGMSTLAYCHEGNVNKVWDNYNNRGMSVADSFIDGFSGWGVVPLCITTGGSNIFTTPLYDAKFTNQPNTSGNTHYHILYASGTGSAVKPWEIPKTLPRFKLVAADIHPSLRKAVAPLNAFAGGKANVQIESLSGAVHLRAVQDALPTEPVIAEREYLARSKNLIQAIGWHDPNLGEPVVTRLMTASMPIGGKPGDIKQMQKGVVVTYKRQIEVEGRRINVLGAGGVVRIEMSNSGSVLNASRVWRKIERTRDVIQLKSFEEARDEALKRLINPNVYRLDQWSWGYMEPAGNVKLDTLSVVFDFAFVPKNHEDMRNNPPRIVRISGEKN
jgi:Peptidase family C25